MIKSNHDGSFVLVTGGAGYIGCQLVPTLLDGGYRVRVYDVMFYGDAGLDRVRDRIEAVEGDIRSVPADIPARWDLRDVLTYALAAGADPERDPACLDEAAGQAGAGQAGTGQQPRPGGGWV